MNKRKLSRRLHMTVVWNEGERSDPTPGLNGASPIYSENQHFRLRRKHLKGSNRPMGFYHDTFDYEATVTVRWLWTVEHEHFAPEVSFRPCSLGLQAVQKIATAMAKIGKHKLTPENLCEELGAMIVESVPDEIDDRGEGRYDDYRPFRLVGEPAMVTLARAAL